MSFTPAHLCTRHRSGWRLASGAVVMCLECLTDDERQAVFRGSPLPVETVEPQAPDPSAEGQGTATETPTTPSEPDSCPAVLRISNRLVFRCHVKGPHERHIGYANSRSRTWRDGNT